MTHSHSLRAKLSAIGPGEAVWLADVFCPGKATTMERAVTTMVKRDEVLRGRQFVTERWTGIKGTPATTRQLLMVHRVDNPYSTKT